MKNSTSLVGGKLSDEQVNDVLLLAKKIEKVVSILNLSLRNYSQVPDETESDNPEPCPITCSPQ